MKISDYKLLDKFCKKVQNASKARIKTISIDLEDATIMLNQLQSIISEVDKLQQQIQEFQHIPDNTDDIVVKINGGSF